MAPQCRFLIAISGLLPVVWLWSCTAQKREPTLRIGVAQYLNHPGLDATRAGFMQEMSRLGFTEQTGTQFDYQNASGDLSTARSIAEEFVSAHYSLIFAIATLMSQAVQKAAQGTAIFILFGAITDPVSAGLVQSMERPGGNITGTSDRWPYQKQMELIREVVPSARRVGVVFNPGEANTRYAMNQTRAAAKVLGLALVEAAVSGPNDIIEAVESIIRKSDVLYVPADNTAMAGATTIVRTADKYRIPVIAGDAGTFDAGCLVGLGVSYTDLGVEAAHLADKILRDRAKPGDLPVIVSGRAKLMANLAVAKKLGVKIPGTIIGRADIVTGK